MPRVDRGEVERRFQPGEMEVVLLVERGDEPVGSLPVRIQLPLRRRGRGHRRLRILAVLEFVVRTVRKTQLVTITEQVRDALGDGDGGSAALVSVPQTS